MWEILFWLFVFVVVGAAIYLGAPIAKAYLETALPANSMFGARSEKRLDIVEQSNLDGRRRLVLIRRDDVEHLIMTGGPVDVVIETNIEAKRPARVMTSDPPGAEPIAFGRQPRSLGQTTTES